jgi:hypothetical protein
MSDLRIDLPAGAAFAPGAEIRARVAWRLDPAPESLELRLFWHTVGKGTEDVEIVERVTLPPSTAGEQDLALRSPVGPYSFSGRLISLVWALELVAEPSGETARAELVIAPDGEEIRLGGAAPGAEPV